MTSINSTKHVYEILVSRTAGRVEEMVREVNGADKYYCWCSNYNDAITALPKELETMAELVVKINQLKFSKITGAKTYNKYIEERITYFSHELGCIAGNPLIGGVGLIPCFNDLI